MIESNIFNASLYILIIILRAYSNELDFFPHDSISNSRSNSNIKLNDNNYYKKWLRSCIEEVTKYFTAPKSRVVITDYGLLNLLV